MAQATILYDPQIQVVLVLSITDARLMIGTLDSSGPLGWLVSEIDNSLENIDA